MQTLRNALKQSERDGAAIGHFNVADLVLLKAVVAAGQNLKVPVAVGASEGEREFFGVRQIAALVRSLREESDYPIFLNADHTHSLAHAVDVAKRALTPSSSTYLRCRSSRTSARRKKPLKPSRPSILQSLSRARLATLEPGLKSMKPHPLCRKG